MFPITAVGSVRRYGRWWLRKCSSPSLSSPIALSIPLAVSTVRGGALPARGAAVTVFGTTPPSLAKSTNPAISFA